MCKYTVLGKNRYFEVLGGLNRENRSDNKVGMISELNMSSVQRLRNKYAERNEAKPSYTALVAKAVSLALRRHPHANRIPFELPFRKRLVQLESVDMTIAVERDRPDIEQAVFAGTIKNTDTKSLTAITEELRGLAMATTETNERWKALKWIVENLPCGLARAVLSLPRWSPRLWIKHRGGAVMISSPAKYGVDLMVGAWPWPLGVSFGLVKERPVVIDGKLAAAPTMALTLSFDRRLMGGAPAARFFKSVCEFLEQAEDYLERRVDEIEIASEYAEKVG